MKKRVEELEWKKCWRVECIESIAMIADCSSALDSGGFSPIGCGRLALS